MSSCTEQHWCSERDQGLRLCCCASAPVLLCEARKCNHTMSSPVHLSRMHSKSLRPWSRSLHQCCSVKQDDNSLACHNDKQGCCHLASQSSTGAVSVTRVSGFVAVHLCWNAPELREVKETHRCDCTDKQGCCHPASQSSTGAVSVTRVSGFVAVHLCWNAPELQNS